MTSHLNCSRPPPLKLDYVDHCEKRWRAFSQWFAAITLLQRWFCDARQTIVKACAGHAAGIFSSQLTDKPPLCNNFGENTDLALSKGNARDAMPRGGKLTITTS